MSPLPPEQATSPRPDTRPAATARDVGEITLRDVSLAVGGFYGGSHFLGRVSSGEHTSMVSYGDNERAVVGTGEDAGTAVIDTLRAMHSLETVKTKPILRLPMRGGATVDFTTLEHYSPKIAPSNKVYEVPGYLSDMFEEDTPSMATYETTIATSGWSAKLFAQMEAFLANSPKGNALLRDLKITSLRALTPEQAVKLSLATVQSLSKYSRDAVGRPDGEAADSATTMQLLQAGITHLDDPAWRGNGVCRNIASNVKAVFEALKEHQGKLSMLHNTYCTVMGGVGGAGYRNERQDAHSIQLDVSGHAWNGFVTVDARGSASVSVVDATWALGRDTDQADYTMERMAVTARSLFEKSDDKSEAFDALNDYYAKLGRIQPGEGPSVRQQRNKFIMTEYLKAAEVVLPDVSAKDAPMVPPGVTATAYQLKDLLDSRELQTLFDMSQAGWIRNFDAILGSYLTGGLSPIHGTYKINRLVVHDPGLQNAIYAHLGKATALDYAEQSPEFRARLRQLQPEWLPSIDPSTRIGQRDISLIGQQNGLHIVNPARYGLELRGRLKRLAPDATAYNAVVGEKTDLELLRRYRELANRLQAEKQEPVQNKGDTA